MKDYLRLLLLRTTRRRLPLVIVFGAMAFPLLVCSQLPPGQRATPLQVESWVADVGVCVGSIAVALVLSWAIHEERIGGRGNLLRNANVDGAAAVGALLGLSVLVALVVASTACAVPAILGWGGSVSSWAKAMSCVALYSCCAAPLSIAGASLLPRSMGLPAVVGMAAAGCAGFIVLIDRHLWHGAGIAAAAAAVLTFELVSWIVLSFQWRREVLRAS